MPNPTPPPPTRYLVIAEDDNETRRHIFPSRETQLAGLTALLVRFPDAVVIKDVILKGDDDTRWGDREIRVIL